MTDRSNFNVFWEQINCSHRNCAVDLCIKIAEHKINLATVFRGFRNKEKVIKFHMLLIQHEYRAQSRETFCLDSSRKGSFPKQGLVFTFLQEVF